ncbi:MAG: EF-P lysine aminoacylase EpmA [Pirellulaceae bacterium]
MSWKPTASREVLQLRSETLRRIREFFYQIDFTEVQTPVLSRDTVVDRHLDPIEVPVAGFKLGTHLDGADGDKQPTDAEMQSFYLQTSPEFAMKRLMASGFEAIFEIGPAFRAGELGPLHNPEFTMLEWYRAGDDLSGGVQLLADLAKRLFDVEEVEVVTYRELFLKYTEIDVLAASERELARWSADRLDVSNSWSDLKDDWLDLIFADWIQPKVSSQTPCIVTHYPASQAALARVCEHDCRVAERFELIYKGIELANGYHELLDAEELIQRNNRVNTQRRADGKVILPVQSRMIKAMQSGLPACSGCALGLDRAIMILAEAQDIQEVLCFPITRS